jgi:hypothetical protein
VTPVRPDRAGRIAFLTRDLEGGGVQRSMLVLAGAFAARGHAVDLVSYAGTGGLRPLLPPGVRLVPLPPRRRTGRFLALAADPGGVVGGAVEAGVGLARTL